jgi:hypothetical protein
MLDCEWLVIVDRSRPDLYAWLRRRLGGRADVLFDRREPERRRVTEERRQPMTLTEASLWSTWGYRVAFRRPARREDEASLKALVHSLAVAANLATPLHR